MNVCKLCCKLSCSSWARHYTNSVARVRHLLERRALTANLASDRETLRRRSQARNKSNDVDTSLFVPVPLKRPEAEDGVNIGEELSSPLQKSDVKKLLSQFVRRPEILALSKENGLDSRLFNETLISFRRYCVEVNQLPPDLHIIFSDISQGAGHVDDLYPYFMEHAKQIFPHLSCLEDLRKISDLRLPANWYPEARGMNRKIIMHVGPTNSGKTYHALQRFLEAKSGVYCGPLKLLANEVYSKTNEKGTPCDLITGEERLYANPNKSSSTHVACTVEMTMVNMKYEVAVIDEIQMIRDQGRGWAWTRALLGVAAEEIHLCGEAATVDLVKTLCEEIGEEVEVRKYNRLTSIQLEDQALGDLRNVKPGDCIVCFNKADIYNVSRKIEQLGHQCAVIYGSLPPGTKLAQAHKFNDPADPCKILVATDAIGMGLNLSIRRVIFYSLIKPMLNEKGERDMETIPTSQALQIGGRAGRYGTKFAEGRVTTFKPEDVPTLRALWEREVPVIEAAGLHPTADQIELFAYNLPDASLSNLIDIFVSLCQVDDSHYFMCVVEDFKFLANMIHHVPLPLRARYVFCCAPINRKYPFVCNMFLKFARQYSINQPITFQWLCEKLGWPFSPPATIVDLIHLEAIFDILDCYLWLSYRFTDLFPHVDLVRDMQQELDAIIQVGVVHITTLLKNSEIKGVKVSEDDSFEVHNKKSTYDKRRTQAAATAPPSRFADAVEHEDDDGGVLKETDGLPVKIGGGRLADRLVAQGLLTPDELRQLQAEWKRQLRVHDEEDGKAPKAKQRSGGVELTKVKKKVHEKSSQKKKR